MRLASIAFCLLILLAFHDAAAATDQTLRLAPGARATIALKENPSTGYKWQIAPAESSNLAIVRITDRGFARNGSAGKPRIGAPGMHRWSVVARAVGSARIVLVYRRPWEQKPIRRYEVGVEVTAR
jgi:inhibitor of cysteine peptidase